MPLLDSLKRGNFPVKDHHIIGVSLPTHLPAYHRFSSLPMESLSLSNIRLELGPLHVNGLDHIHRVTHLFGSALAGTRENRFGGRFLFVQDWRLRAQFLECFT
jgi:hypothetical protein